mgnify:CR=1 FL=1
MDYDIIAKSYNELYEEEQLIKLRIIKGHLKVSKTSKLLDIGCGTGISTNFFDCKTTGIDPSSKMIKYGKGNLIKAKAEKLPFKDKTFDIIISVSSIHNFENPEKAINEIIRVKKDNSQIAITLLKKSKNYNKIKKLLITKLKLIEEIDETKDTIFIMR